MLFITFLGEKLAPAISLVPRPKHFLSLRDSLLAVPSSLRVHFVTLATFISQERDGGGAGGGGVVGTPSSSQLHYMFK